MNTKFIVGREYFTRSIANHDCVYTVRIVRKSASSIWFETRGEVKRRKLMQNTFWDGVQQESFFDSTWVFTSDRPVDTD